MVNQKLLKEIGRQIAKKRLTIGISQQYLERKSGLFIGQIAKYEAGKINITIESLERICEAMGCRLDITIRKVINKADLIEEETGRL